MSQATFVKLARYELKYHIHMDTLERIETFLRPWCGLDPHSEKSPDGFYWVTSLYLDTPRLMLARNRETGLALHTNLRIRAYGESPTPTTPKHFEIKRWEGDIVEKTRGTVHDGDAASLWQDTTALLARSRTSDRRNLESFHLRATAWNASPVLLTQYRRKAWFGLLEDYARITVDTHLRYREESGFDFSVQPSQMRPSDPPDNFRPGNHAILELKCNRESVPLWMLDLIRLLNLERDGYSKYVYAMRDCQMLPSMRGSNLW
jgi:hypothetical protein